MKRFPLLAALAVLTVSVSFAQETPEFPKPTKEHEWLQKFVGEWEGTSQCQPDPSQPPIQGKMHESVKSLGGFWIVSTGEAEMMGMKMDCVMTVGYSPEKKKYIGTWTDSMINHLWQYEGFVDETGKILTLEATGPNPMKPGTTAKFRDVTEFVSNDERLFSSFIQNEKGEWVKMASGVSKRKK